MLLHFFISPVNVLNGIIKKIVLFVTNNKYNKIKPWSLLRDAKQLKNRFQLKHKFAIIRKNTSLLFFVVINANLISFPRITKNTDNRQRVVDYWRHFDIFWKPSLSISHFLLGRLDLSRHTTFDPSPRGMTSFLDKVARTKRKSVPFRFI